MRIKYNHPFINVGESADEKATVKIVILRGVFLALSALPVSIAKS